MNIAEFKDQIMTRGASIAAAAEEVCALILAVEGMIEDQRRIMQEANAASYLQESELWGGMEILLLIAKRTAEGMEKDGTAIQDTGMTAVLPFEAASS